MGWQDGDWWQQVTSQRFKWSSSNTAAHSGEDFAMPVGTPVKSPTAGVVRDAEREPWGYQVDEVSYLPGYGVVTESFLHLSSLAVHKGDTVFPGEVIGKSGTPPSSQYGNGPHLHFEMTSGANSPYIDYSPHSPTDSQHPIDPTAFVTALRAGQGAMAGGAAGGNNPLDPQTWVAAVQHGITAPFQALGIDSLQDFFWRSALIGLGGVLVLYALFKLFEPGVKTAINVGVSAAKVGGAVAA